MKHFFLFLLLAAQTNILVARQNADKVPFLTKSLSSGTFNSVEVQTSGGSISVAGVSSDFKVEVYVTGNNNKTNLTKEEIQTRINEKYDFNVAVSNNKLTASAKPKERMKDWKEGLSFSFKLFVPVDVAAELTTSGGSINLNNLSGKLDFTTSGGSLHLDKITGKTNGRTSGGSIHVANSKNDIDLSTSGGSIDAENCEGTLKLTTSGGSLNLMDLKGNITAHTSGGSINGSKIEGELLTHTSGGSIHLADLSCSLETSTSGGNIHIAILNPGKYIKISNSAGNVDLQLPKNKGVDLNLNANKIKTDNLESFNGKMTDEQVVGKLNGGGIPVSVNAGSGKINLMFK
ncbi:MAG: hypothetical protein V4717_10210 [Bacteroidota bacterium]